MAYYSPFRFRFALPSWFLGNSQSRRQLLLGFLGVQESRPVIVTTTCANIVSNAIITSLPAERAHLTQHYYITYYTAENCAFSRYSGAVKNEKLEARTNDSRTAATDFKTGAKKLKTHRLKRRVSRITI